MVAVGGPARVNPACLETALRQSIGPIPALASEEIHSSISRSGLVAVASVSHSSSVAATRRYRVERDGEVTLFDGLPLLTDGGFLADARGLAQRLSRSAEGVEGMFVVVRLDLDGDVAEVHTDPLGNLAVYETTATDGTHYVSNSLTAIASLQDRCEPDLVGAATFLTLGWYGAGRSALAGARLVGGGTRLVLRPGRPLQRTRYYGPEIVARTVREAPTLDAVRDQLTGQMRSAASYGVPLRLGLTAGHDSRICLAVALAADVEVELYTEGAIGDLDVDVARAVARKAGLPHEVIPRDWRTPADVGAIFREFVGGGDATSTFAQVEDLVAAPETSGALGIKVLGLGGETARASTHPIRGYLVAGVPLAKMRAVQSRLFAQKLTLAEGLIRPLAREIACETVDRWFGDRRAEGWGTRSLAETLYVFDAMIRQHQGSWRRTAPVNDLAAPLSSSSFVTYSLGLAPRRRYARGVHRALIAATAPSLLDVPAEPPLDRQSAMLSPLSSAAELVRLAWSSRRRGGPGSEAKPAREASWSAQSALHLSMVESARESALDTLIDRDVMVETLRGERPVTAGALRGLTLMWWFETVAGERSQAESRA